jgi:hypothetical protein
MKITKQKLVKIIKEELEAALEEGDASSAGDPDVGTDAYNKGFLDAYFELDEEGARKALDDAREDVGLEADDAQMRTRALQLLKPSKGALGPGHDDGGLPF